MYNKSNNIIGTLIQKSRKNGSEKRKKKIVACVAEFNPLHSGHLRLFDAVKRNLSPDIFAVVLSGNFSERGDVMVKNKHIRAQWAINAGADVALELPFFTP